MIIGPSRKRNGVVIENHVFAYAGQSNADGRGEPYSATLDASDPDILVWDHVNQILVEAEEPIRTYGTAGTEIGFALAFGKKYRETHAPHRVVFVRATEGGTGFRDNRWNDGDDLHEALVSRVNTAMGMISNAVFKGFLWHQGERDAQGSAAEVAAFEAALQAAVTAFRTGVTAAGTNTPFIPGAMMPAQVGSDADWRTVDEALWELPVNLPAVNFAPATFLVANDAVTDPRHYDAPSQRTMGASYAEAYEFAVVNDLLTAVQGLFSPGDMGGLWRFDNAAGNFQNSDQTGAAAADSPLGYVQDLSGLGYPLEAQASGNRPTLRNSGSEWWCEFDGVDDYLGIAENMLFYGAGMTFIFGVRSNGGQANERIVCQASSQNDNAQYALLQPSTSPGALARNFVRNDTNNTLLTAGFLNQEPFDGTWHTFAWIDEEEDNIGGDYDLIGQENNLPPDKRSYTRNGVFTFDRFAIGGLWRQSGASNFFEMDVTAAFSINRRMSSAEIALVQAWIRSLTI